MTAALSVAAVGLMMVLCTVAVLRSNRRLATHYEQLRGETIEAWKTYLETEHRRMLSDTAATVARLNAVARTFLARDMPQEIQDALYDSPSRVH